MKNPLYLKPYTLNPTRSGQALVEVLVAVSVLTMGLFGILLLLSRSISLNRVIADNHTATYLAAEGVEVVKNILDANSIQSKPWAQGITFGDFQVAYDSETLGANTGNKLRFDPIFKTYGYNGPQETPFIRTIRIEPINRNGAIEEIKVISEVNWITRGGGEFKIEVEDHFYDWRKYAEN